MKPSGVITLMTDFGLSEPYVGVMKAVILGHFASAVMVDLTHEIPAQDVAAASFWVERAYRWFPLGTVHLVVVDPGVGSARRAVVLEHEGHLFVGPDNGVFASLLDGASPKLVREIDQRLVGACQLSPTFHGRDLFAPVAAVLASGANDVKSIGAACELAPGHPWRPLRVPGEPLEGRVIVVDHFGNLITDIEACLLDMAPQVQVIVAGRTVPQVRTYADAKPGQCVALVGSFDTLEIAARDASAAMLLGVKLGDRVFIESN
jgi:hypothetical protein